MSDESHPADEALAMLEHYGYVDQQRSLCNAMSLAGALRRVTQLQQALARIDDKELQAGAKRLARQVLFPEDQPLP